ncbi:MAG: PAS domain-containing protein [Calditrichaeota bacterium]|nr:PAS domain-containing protein [Calditrichota bacterium]
MTGSSDDKNLIWTSDHFPTEEDFRDFRQAGDGVLAVDENLIVISFSEAAERISGITSDQIVGKSCYDVLKMPICQKDQLVGQTLKSGRIFSNITTTLRHAAGETLEVVVSVSPLMSVEGGIAGAVLSFRDLTEMDRLASELLIRNRELLRERNKLTAILNSITDGVFTINTDWQITSFNLAAERITGYSSNEVLGKHCWEVFRGSNCDTNCPMRRALQTGEPTFNLEVEIVSREGKTIPVSVTSSALINEKGEASGAVETFRDLSPLRELKSELEERYRFDQIIGKSKPMQDLYDLLEDVAATDATVLVQGESGTGKELVVKAIHFNSLRRSGPFISVNCAALPETLLESELFGYEKGAFTGAVREKPGRFELADGGTLFLDEIGEMSYPLQAKLLRVLDEHVIERVGGIKSIRVDVRIVAATNKNLRDAVETGAFRQDLFYRLNVVPIHLPPLRERKEDIPLLVDYFIQKFNEKMGKRIRGVSSEVLRIFMDYNWPGNVRELENLLEFSFIQCKTEIITVQHLPTEFQRNFNTLRLTQEKPGEALLEYEKNLIYQTLIQNMGSRVKTARQLGMSKATLWRKMTKYGLLKKDKTD